MQGTILFCSFRLARADVEVIFASAGSLLGGYPVSPSHSNFSSASDARAPSLQSVWTPAYHQGYSVARKALDMQAANLWSNTPTDNLSPFNSMPSA